MQRCRHGQLSWSFDGGVTDHRRSPRAPQPGIHVDAGEPVTGRGQLGLERVAPHLAVVQDRQVDAFLQGDDMADGAILRRLEFRRRQLPARVGRPRGPQVIGPQQAADVLNPGSYGHGTKHPTGLADRPRGRWPDGLVHDERMPLFSFEGRSPAVSPAAWIAPTASIVGDVTIEAEASIWYGAVLRGDLGPIIIRRGANVQDGSIVHGGDDPMTEVGEGATVGHLCVVHSAFIGAEALIGNGATVLDGAVVGQRALVAAGCTVPPGMTIPDGMLAVGVPARLAGELAGNAKNWVQTNPQIYRDLAKRHSAGVRRLDS